MEIYTKSKTYTRMVGYVIIICMFGCGSEYNNCEALGASIKCLISMGGGNKKNVRNSGSLRKVEHVRWSMEQQWMFRKQNKPSCSTRV